MTAKFEITPEVSAAMEALASAVKDAYAAQGGEVDIVHMGVALLPVKNHHLNPELPMGTVVTCGADADAMILCGQLFAEAALKTMAAQHVGDQHVH